MYYITHVNPRYVLHNSSKSLIQFSESWTWVEVFSFQGYILIFSEVFFHARKLWFDLGLGLMYVSGAGDSMKCLMFLSIDS